MSLKLDWSIFWFMIEGTGKWISYSSNGEFLVLLP